VVEPHQVLDATSARNARKAGDGTPHDGRYAARRFSGVNTRAPSVVAVPRVTATNGVESSAPVRRARWMRSRARSCESNGLDSCHLIDPTPVISLTIGPISATMMSISGSFERIQ
jgi:hypothetical protein